MSVKHTPGPWHVQPSDHPGGLLIKPIPGQVVAQCDELPEMEANARLIAAAPEMYEALRNFVSIVPRADARDTRDTSYNNARTQARTALAKAEGRSP